VSPPSASDSPHRLDGWKAIGRFLGRDARTAQRWAQALQLPVRRIAGDGHSVFAWAHELQTWLNRSEQVAAPRAAPPQTARAPGLLVLPFQFRGPGGSDRAFVGDAVGAEVLNRLAVAPLRDLRVLSWTTSRAFAQAPKRADQIAQELGVRYLVEGGVDDAGSHWSVDVRVVDALDDRVVLANRFTADGKDVLRLHTTIAEAVSGHLSLNLAGHMLEPFWNDPVDPAAFLAYVGSWRCYTTGGIDNGLRRAVDLAGEAIRLDPGFTPAYALRGLALNFYNHYISYADASLDADTRAMARHAMAAGPRLATSNILDALVATYFDRDWDRSDERYRFVLDRMPSDAHARRNLAFNLSLRGRMDEAQAELDLAGSVDRSPRLSMMQGMLHRFRREYGAAIACHDRVLQAIPGDAISTIHAVEAEGLLLRDERRVRARVAAADAALYAQWGPYFDACIAAASNDAEWLSAARTHWRERALGGSAEWYTDATLAGAAGDIDGVVDSLRRAIEVGHNESVAHARVDPVFDCARDDPRFTALLRQIKLIA
jgi:TolB-like protein